MSKGRKTKSRGPKPSARPFVTSGLAGAAMVGAGLLVAAAPDAPGVASPEIQLASTDSVLIPLAPLKDETCFPYGCSLIGSSLAPPAPNALAAALPGVGVTQFKLFGDGADAPPIAPAMPATARTAGCSSATAATAPTAATVATQGPSHCSATAEPAVTRPKRDKLGVTVVAAGSCHCLVAAVVQAVKVAPARTAVRAVTPRPCQC